MFSGVGGVSPAQVASGGLSRAAAIVRSTMDSSPAASVSVVEPAAVRPSRCNRSRTVVVASATFWWMAELANRVSASARCCTLTSAWADAPTVERTSSITRAASSSSAPVRAISVLIRAPPLVRR
jgi:hypothetical protein